ncbi:1-deoxy-D-xylulose-5-phosphate reductoisomerase [Mesotoga sp.]|uniref:1-deoxy-D-xylulose-5-phosphate reductoisomerase n=1 Tax=Mesotoga sp. TaxID=2053577 RepID=UPI00345F0AAE
MKKRLAVLGSTGSIGSQTLEIVDKIEEIEIVAISCGHNFASFSKQLSKFHPKFAATLERNEDLVDSFPGTTFFHGEEGIETMLEKSRPDYAMLAVSGAAGLRFSLKAAEVCSRLCLANKETIVCGGNLLLEKCASEEVELIPVDSEHSGLFQLLDGTIRPERILITASGGALRDWPKEKIHQASPEDVMKHPVWSMGNRITVDSASMVNKGLEVIEAKYLFGFDSSEIDTYICRNSFVHAGVVYDDGVVKLHVGRPDMRIPISYSLTYPARHNLFGEERIVGIPIVLEELQQDRFPALTLAREICGTVSKQIAYNAADEIAVHAFMKGRMPFGSIYNIIERTVAGTDDQNPTDYSQIIEIDSFARRLAKEEVNRWYCQ